mgnify:CR=1 FL=1
MTYSMTKEDDVVVRYFGDYVGRFLDLGAHDGITLSNTRLLAERGWSGVAVEASFESATLWYANMGSFANVKLVNAPVTAHGGIVDFWYVKGTCESTCSEELKEKSAVRRGATPILMEATTIERISQSFPGAFDFISIDLDGLSLEVMRSINYAALGVRAVCIEYLHDDLVEKNEAPLVREYMESQGFKLLHLSPENVIMVRR